MIFLDASAVVALIVDEPDATALAERLAGDEDRIHSALWRWETVAALTRLRAFGGVEAATVIVDRYLGEIGSRLVQIGAIEADHATQALSIYGKGRHPAALNLGDCFAYACAKAAGASLLYKGGDFALTDLA